MKFITTYISDIYKGSDSSKIGLPGRNESVKIVTRKIINDLQI